MPNQLEVLCRPEEEECLVRSVLEGLAHRNIAAQQSLLSVPLEAFTHGQARSVWETMLVIYRQGDKVNLASVKRAMTDRGIIRDRNGWMNITAWLTSGGTEEPGAVTRLVVGLYQRRQLLKRVESALADVANPVLNHLSTVQNLTADITHICSGRDDRTIRAGDYIMQRVNNGLKICADQGDRAKLAYFGLDHLDGEPDQGGIPAAPGHVVIIGARPGVGKTALATQVAGATAGNGIEVFVASLELSEDEFAKRLGSWFSEIRRGVFDEGRYEDGLKRRLANQSDALNRVSIWAPPRPTWSQTELAIRTASLNGAKVVIIDHFSEINTSGLAGPRASNSENAKECSQRIKSLAKELHLCIVLLAQFNREIPRGEVPGTENLRETGELEQVAYSILALYRDQPAAGAKAAISLNKGPDALPPAEIPPLKLAVIKNRDGSCGLPVHLRLMGSTCRITVA